jgi:hypothetical protein
MKLRRFIIGADPAIMERFAGGFVQRFHRETICITLPYSIAVAAHKLNADSHTVAFRFSDAVGAPCRWSKPLPCHNLQWPFEFRGYVEEGDRTAKKRRILDALHAAAGEVATVYSWDKNVLAEAYTSLVEQNCRFTGLSKTTYP